MQTLNLYINDLNFKWQNFKWREEYIFVLWLIGAIIYAYLKFKAVTEPQVNRIVEEQKK
jgi:hypothetical protein